MKNLISLIVIVLLCAVGYFTYQKYMGGSTATDVDIPLKESYELSQRPDIIVLDVRTEKELKEGHLPNAMLLDIKGSNFEQSLGLLDKNATYLVYCQSGRRSAQAINLMKKAGFKNIYHMKDGIIGWKAAGYPTEQ